jgi:hypothetical protein
MLHILVCKSQNNESASWPLTSASEFFFGELHGVDMCTCVGVCWWATLNYVAGLCLKFVLCVVACCTALGVGGYLRGGVQVQRLMSRMLSHQRETVTVSYPVFVVDLFVVLTHARSEVDWFPVGEKNHFIYLPGFAKSNLTLCTHSGTDFHPNLSGSVVLSSVT